MDPPSPSAAYIPIDLGPAAEFEQSIFPIAFYEAEGNFNKGVVLIRATLDEMERIKELGIDLNENHAFIFNTRVKIEELREQVTEFQGQGKNKFPNPFKAFRNYRALRMFVAASKSVYLHTKRTSERIHREAVPRIVSNTQMRLVDGTCLPPGTRVGGLIVDLPGGYNDIARQTINDATGTMATIDPFQEDSRVSQLRDDEQAISLVPTEIIHSQDGTDVVEENRTSVASSDLQRSHLTSPQLVQNHFHIHNSIVATNSNLTAPTVNHGSRLSGASVTQQFSP